MSCELCDVEDCDEDCDDYTHPLEIALEQADVDVFKFVYSRANSNSDPKILYGLAKMYRRVCSMGTPKHVSRGLSYNHVDSDKMSHYDWIISFLRFELEKSENTIKIRK